MLISACFSHSSTSLVYVVHACYKACAYKQAFTVIGKIKFFGSEIFLKYLWLLSLIKKISLVFGPKLFIIELKKLNIKYNLIKLTSLYQVFDLIINIIKYPKIKLNAVLLAQFLLISSGLVLSKFQQVHCSSETV